MLRIFLFFYFILFSTAVFTKEIPVIVISAGKAAQSYSSVGSQVKIIDSEMIESFLEELKNLKIYNLQESVIRPSNVRLTLDYEEDYLLMKVIAQILGKNTSRDQIDNLFVNNPDLAKINWFRNTDWKAKQNSKINK